MTQTSLLNVKNLELSYGGIDALRGVDLSVEPGEIVCLIGANGAGKTSCLRAISGLTPNARGSITFHGESSLSCDPATIVRRGLAHIPEGRMILGRQTVEDNLKLGAWIRTDKRGIRATIDEMYGLFPRLKERRQQFAGTLSGGEQQMLAIARALMAKPRLLMLDEPSLGLAPLVVSEIFAQMATLNRAGMALLLVEQNAQLALQLAHRAYVLERGVIKLEGKAQDLLGDPRVKAAYLGEAII